MLLAQPNSLPNNIHDRHSINSLSETKIPVAEFANSIDLDEPPHLHLHCLLSSL